MVKKLLLAFLTVSVAIQVQAQNQLKGVTVDQVQKGSQGWKAGLLVGDVIQSWSRSGLHGEVHSPFDLKHIETEQGPRGEVQLEGMRGREKRAWRLGPDVWRFSTRPVLPPALLAVYDPARRLANSGEYAKAVARLTATTGFNKDDNVWLSSWWWFTIADWHARAQQFKEADTAFEEAIRVSAGASSMVTGHILRSWGSLLLTRGENDKSIDCYKRSLAIFQAEAESSLEIAKSLAGLGQACWFNSDPDTAERYYGQALAMREQLAPESLPVATSLDDLALPATSRGDLATAERYGSRALRIFRKLAPEGLDTAMSLDNAAILLSKRGDMVNAEEYHRQALEIFERLAPGGLDSAFALINIGTVAMDRGDVDSAEEKYRRALAIFEKLQPGMTGVATTYTNLGNVAVARHNLAMAEEYERKALALREKLAPGTIDVAESLNSLGEVVHARGRLDEAEQLYQRAITVGEKHAPDSLDVAWPMHNLGRLSAERGDLAKADELLRRTLSIRQRLAPGSIVEAETLHLLASTLARKGERENALATYERAVKALENQTGKLGGAEDVRSAFHAQYNDYYREYVNLLLAGNQFDRAFQVLERSRARAMLTMLAERDLMFGSDVPEAIQNERRLNATDYDAVQADLTHLSPVKDAAKIEQLLARERDLASKRALIRERIKQSSPRLAALQYPQPLDVEGARNALDAGDVMISYSVSADHTSIFVIRPVGQDVPALAVHQVDVTEKALRNHIQEFRRLLEERSQAHRPALNAQARALYDLLLKPVEPDVSAALRLVIVPDGPLHILPFTALARGDEKFLIEWKPLRTVVSATVYAELKGLRNTPKKPGPQVVAFGDPVYPSVANQSNARGASAELRSAAGNGLKLTRLPFSREEVNGIGKLYGQEGQVYLAGAATEERAKSATANARYVHFAAHGFLDERFPLNSFLALTIPEKAAAGKDNGLLQAWEILEQVRLSADLVVLSACQTGMGKEMSGEGLIGLTRAFQYAGARSIVASLWNVDDSRTAELMKSFYAQLHEGKSKDEALRAAQQAMLATRSSSHPFYWAAFTLIGDWQ